MSERELTLRGGRLSAAAAGELVQHVAIGTAAGVPLDDAFLALAEDADHPALERVAARLAAELRRGADARTALEAVKGQLPAHMRRAVAASEDVGQMAAVLAGLAEHESARQRLRRQLRTVLFYPAIVFGLLAAVVTGLTVAVVPEFEKLYTDFDMVLPNLTVFLIGSAHLVPVAAGGVLALLAAYFIVELLPGGARLVHWLRTGAPVIGRLWIWNSQHEFASILGALAAHHVPLDDALACTAESLRDRNVARAVRLVAQKCAAGMPLSRSLAESIHFDPALPALAGWGEAEGALPAALRQAAATFEQELDLQAAFLQRIIPPILFVTVVTTMFFFVIALFIPLIQLINALM
jgi:type II secretory pathway component PulF